MYFNYFLKFVFDSIANGGNDNAFYIKGEYFSYQTLAQRISVIRTVVREIPDDNIALVANDDINTYASIFALWAEGKCYVPIHPMQPKERCRNIIEQVGTSYVIDSSDTSRYDEYHVISTGDLIFNSYNMDINNLYDEEKLAYILFTSGSTGNPKGVKISRGNVAAFIDAFNALGYHLDKNDRCLQMFDLTFDLSVMSYLIPVMHGACAYTVSPERIKYEAAFELFDEQEITFAMMVPSVIHYLRPYMDEIQIPSLRYSMFAGEALPLDDVKQWKKCVPNAIIENTYGPTECTIICTAYRYTASGWNKEVNGTMCIGKGMLGTDTIIIDSNEGLTENGKKGELCLAGPQLTQGYWENEEKDKECFFIHDNTRFYKTGDICSMDQDGDIAYYGRKDSQVKIQGFRIELSEIECVARQFYKNETAVVAVPVNDDKNNCTIQIAIEKEKSDDNKALTNFLKKFLPSYMIPAHIHYMNHFPLNANNKVDRKKISRMINNHK